MLGSHDGVDSAGDGTVPRVSATPVELSDQGREIYAPDQHGSLQNGIGPLTQLTGLLSAQPTSNVPGRAVRVRTGDRRGLRCRRARSGPS